MLIRALFIGFSEARSKRVVSSIERASSVTIRAALYRSSQGGLCELVYEFDVLFISRSVKDDRLESLLDMIRQHRTDIPVVITYGSEPDGKAFLLAKKYDCWLFGEMDRLDRTLTPAEIGETLAMRGAVGTIGRRLVEITLCTGPCSTGI